MRSRVLSIMNESLELCFYLLKRHISVIFIHILLVDKLFLLVDIVDMIFNMFIFMSLSNINLCVTV